MLLCRATSIEGWPVQPETRYADSGGVNIAYQVLGDGPRDLVFVMGWVSNIEVFWEEPMLARFLTRLASFSRLILFDKRGTGLSDRVPDMPSLEVRMDDVRVVMDAAASERAAFFGVSEGGPMSALFSATYPRAGADHARRLPAEDQDAGLPLGTDGAGAPGVDRANATRMGRNLRPRRARA